MPAGLSVGVSSGNCVVTGTPTATASGTTVQIRGTNAGGTGSAATFTFNISLGLPVITSGTPATGAEGIAYGGYTITATNSPTSYSVLGTLPPGLTLNAGTGAITGTPTVTAGPYPQTYPVTVQATNATGTGSASRTFTINKPVPTVSVPGSPVFGYTGVAFS